MRQFIATVDTSVFISLQCGELLAAVTVLFERLLVPTKVRKELERGGERSRAAREAIEEFAIFEPCDDYDRASVKVLLDTREHLRLGKDEGEAEAVIQASKRSAMILTDDQLGRTWAERHRLECHGTLWICRELRFTGYLTELRPYYVRMLKHSRRLPLSAINDQLLEFHEPAITEEEHRAYKSSART